MAKNNTNVKKGFTIIEVVLVLAIAGLIFLMVFIALPALQRSQRDTQRRDDMARFLSQINQYQANNNGRVPSEKSGLSTDSARAAEYNDPFIAQYLLADGDKFEDPSGTENSQGKTTYEVVAFQKCTSAEGGCKNLTKTNEDYGKLGKIVVYSNARCDGEDPQYIQGDRKIAITINLEGAGYYCGNN